MRRPTVAAATVVGVIAALSLATSRVDAQNGDPAAERTTKSGVYSDAQASRGNDTYLMQCRSCHTPASHTGVVFANSWGGRPLSALYTYMVERMPKNEPGSLQPHEYAELVAYLLKLNDMPSGSAELPADSTLLRKIRIEVDRKDP
jgi:mono/diheme cytochrome c family protein